ncbi:MAG: heme exporter protein CcmD [Roseicyclus sp.]|jgi:heme exporter protein D
MPDLGSYATEVLSAYAGTLILLAAIVVASVWKARQVRARLDEAETRRGRV